MHTITKHLPRLVVAIPAQELRLVASGIFGILVFLVIQGISWLLPAAVVPVVSYAIPPATMQWLPDQPLAIPVVRRIPLELQYRAATLEETQASFARMVANLRHPAYNRRPSGILNPFVVEYKGQCTSYAWGRAYEVTGHRLAANINRNAGYWAADAKAAGYRVDMEPSANSIAVWQRKGYRRGVGHVAYVEGVAGDKVLISEANWVQRGGKHVRKNGFTLRYSTASSMERRGFVFVGFIHLDQPQGETLVAAK